MNAHEKAREIIKKSWHHQGFFDGEKCERILAKALLQARDEALELAAQECFKWIDAECCADAIRALKSKKE